MCDVRKSRSGEWKSPTAFSLSEIKTHFDYFETFCFACSNPQNIKNLNQVRNSLREQMMRCLSIQMSEYFSFFSLITVKTAKK